jgi:hypothetical protein
VVIANARAAADVVRVFEWIDVEPHLGHPHELTSVLLDEWLDYPAYRWAGDVNEGGAVGRAYVAVSSQNAGTAT